MWGTKTSKERFIVNLATPWWFMEATFHFLFWCAFDEQCDCRLEWLWEPLQGKASFLSTVTQSRDSKATTSLASNPFWAIWCYRILYLFRTHWGFRICSPIGFKFEGLPVSLLVEEPVLNYTSLLEVSCTIFWWGHLQLFSPHIMSD